ncbi:hypothetical protein M3J09_007090 [Ascochyta lentis]
MGFWRLRSTWSPTLRGAAVFAAALKAASRNERRSIGKAREASNVQLSIGQAGEGRVAEKSQKPRADVKCRLIDRRVVT